MKTIKFNFTRKQNLILIREIIRNHMNYNNYEIFIKTLIKENNCSSIDELYEKINTEIKK